MSKSKSTSRNALGGLALWSVLCVALGGTTATSAQVLEVPSTSSAGVYSPPLTAGQPYLFEVSGTWTPRNVLYLQYGAPLADAEYEVAAGPPYDPTRPWAEHPGGAKGYELHDLLVDDTAVDWLGSTDGVTWQAHVFSPNHVYRHYHTGTGGPVHFRICDELPWGPPYYYDNAGSLHMTVTLIPEPATLALLAVGCFALVRRRRSI